jgi:hypothetical protein
VIPKTLPKKYEKVWGEWPTLDQLRAQNPEFKEHQLRATLKGVPCYRCQDSSVRYLPEAVSSVLLSLPGDESDDDTGSPLDESLSPPKAYDVLMLFRECMRMLADQRTQTKEAAKVHNEAIKAMEKPMEMGLGLLQDMIGVMSGRLKHYDETWDRLMSGTESLMLAQSERELQIVKAKDKQELRKQTLELAAGYVPTLLSHLSKPAEDVASQALKAMSSLEPEMLDTLLGGEILEPHQREHFARLRDMLKAQRPPNGQANQQTQNHSAPPS